jgi:acetyl-CoA carboxylase carboxyl transferase subunit beta
MYKCTVDSAGARAAVTAVAADFTDFGGHGTLTGEGPLGWPGYAAERARATAASGEDESVLCGLGTVGGVRAVLVAFDFRYLGGSVGSVAGARICDAFSRARELGRPIVSLIATGGSRMQEGMLSLAQLQRIAAHAARTRAAGIPHVAVLRDPTTGGLWASLGAGADVVLGIGGAQVGFAGRRVRPAADADDPAYTAEGQYAAGSLDEVTALVELPGVLGTWLRLLGPGAPGDTPTPAEVPRPLGATTDAADGWTAVTRARDPRRPRAAAYLADHFETYRLISGDRAGGVDPGMLCGIGRRGGRSIAFAAQTGTATTPAGFRTAARLVRLADSLGLPVLTLVDTPGAAADAAAERAGVGPSIAALFDVIARATVPVTTLVVGEGGSGGALALAAPGNTWVTPDAYFSVTAPELAAAIRKRDPADVPATADDLRLRPRDLVELGVVRGVAGADTHR